MDTNAQAAALQNSTANLREQVSLMKEMLYMKRESLSNSLTGLAQGMGMNSMRMDNLTSIMPLMQSNLYMPLTLNYVLLTFLWKSHGIVRTMISAPVADAWRGGLEYESQELDAADFGELEDFAEEKGIWDTVRSIQNWTRLYGGGMGIVNVGQDWEKPFDERDISRDAFELYDANRWEASGAFRSADSFLFYGHKLDASRVITVAGQRAPHLIRPQLAGWGLSELEQVVEDFNLWLRGRNVLYEILDEAKVDIYSIKDYAATLAMPGGEALIHKRIAATNAIKNFCNALILDSNDTYTPVANNFSGLSDVMLENRIGIASALRMPMSKIFGLSANGLNASNEEDLETYNGMVESEVREPSKPLIRKVLRLMQLAVFGKVYDLNFKYKPLRILSAADEELIKTSKTSRYLTLHTAGLLDSQEMGELMHRDGLVPIETKAQKGLLPGHPEVPTSKSMFDAASDDAQGAPMTEGQRVLAAKQTPEMSAGQKKLQGEAQ